MDNKLSPVYLLKFLPITHSYWHITTRPKRLQVIYSVIVTSKIPIKRMTKRVESVLEITWPWELCQLEKDVKKADTREFVK
jgi:hypothetical protein